MRSKNPILNLPEELVEQIEQVTEYQIDELIMLVCRRFHQLRQDSECSFLVFSKDQALRRKEKVIFAQELMEDL